MRGIFQMWYNRQKGSDSLGCKERGWPAMTLTIDYSPEDMELLQAQAAAAHISVEEYVRKATIEETLKLEGKDAAHCRARSGT